MRAPRLGLLTSGGGRFLGETGLSRHRGLVLKRILAFCVLAVSTTVGAVVIRADVDDARYRVPPSAFPALVDMPGEGHGVLIAPQWVVTAAHAAPMQMDGMETDVTINGVARKVTRVVMHPGYRKVPDGLIKEVLATGDLTRLHAFLDASDDIALIELAAPVSDVTPVVLYSGSDEVGIVRAVRVSRYVPWIEGIVATPGRKT